MVAMRDRIASMLWCATACASMASTVSWAAPSGRAGTDAVQDGHASAAETSSSAVVRLSRTPPPRLSGPTSLRRLLAAIGDATGVHVQGLWIAKFPGNGLDPDAEVRAEPPVGNCADLLEQALDQVTGPGEPAAWQVTRAGIEVGRVSALWRESALSVRVYDVRDLLLRVPAFRSTGIPQNGASGGGTGGSGGGSGGGGNSGGSSGGGSGSQGGNVEDPTVRPAKEDRRDRIVGLLQRNVVPEAWDTNGGPCTITPHDETLIIRAPEFVHRRIAGPTVERLQPPPERVGSSKSSS